jgi:hypothetical protein
LSKKKEWSGRIYLARDDEGKQRFHWVGRFKTRRERDERVAEERVRIKAEGCGCEACAATGKNQVAGGGVLLTVDAQADRYLADYGRRNKESSWDTQTQRLKRFRRDLGGRALDIPRAELKDWFNGEGAYKEQGPVPIGDRQAIVSFYNHAIDDDDVPLTKSPARGFSELYDGRGEDPPPTEEEFQRLLDACAALGRYAPMMRAVVLFATFELFRPSEVFAVKPSHVDVRRMRVRKAKRLYRGKLDDPKTGPKTVALVPPARDAIAGLDMNGEWLFTSKTGLQLTRSTLESYWNLVLARAGLDFDFYHATKHYGVWFMWRKMGMSEPAIAAQAGWKISTVTKMLETYGHGDVGALEEVDAAWAEAPTTGRPTLRVVSGTQP